MRTIALFDPVVQLFDRFWLDYAILINARGGNDSFTVPNIGTIQIKSTGILAESSGPDLNN